MTKWLPVVAMLLLATTCILVPMAAPASASENGGSRVRAADVLSLMDRLAHLPDLDDVDTVASILGVRFSQHPGPFQNYLTTIGGHDATGREFVYRPINPSPFGQFYMAVLRDPAGRILNRAGMWTALVSLQPYPDDCIRFSDLSRTLTGELSPNLPHSDPRAPAFHYKSIKDSLTLQVVFPETPDICATELSIVN